MASAVHAAVTDPDDRERDLAQHCLDKIAGEQRFDRALAVRRGNVRATKEATDL
jgi:hypothetical protein